MDDYKRRICNICADILKVYSEMDEQLVKPVRCQDCRYREYDGMDWMCNHPLNSDGGTFMSVKATDNHFCSRGQRVGKRLTEEVKS